MVLGWMESFTQSMSMSRSLGLAFGATGMLPALPLLSALTFVIVGIEAISLVSADGWYCGAWVWFCCCCCCGMVCA